MTGFATLRRKLIRRAGRRCGFAHKAADHGRALRDHVGEWSPAELNALVEEYDATAALKDLAVQADLARPPAATVKQDLARLLQQVRPRRNPFAVLRTGKETTAPRMADRWFRFFVVQGAAADTLLVWRQRCYPAHRAILAARCPAFRDLLRDAARSSSPRSPSPGHRLLLEPFYFIDIPGSVGKLLCSSKISTSLIVEMSFSLEMSFNLT